MSDLTDAQRVARGEHAQRALEEFLNPAFDAVVAAYMDRMEEIASREPWAADKITALATAVRIAKEAHQQIAALVAEGTHARSQMVRAERIENLSPARRRLAAIGGL